MPTARDIDRFPRRTQVEKLAARHACHACRASDIAGHWLDDQADNATNWVGQQIGELGGWLGL